MAIHGGRFGTINGIPAVKSWQINDDGNLSRFINSATAMGHGRRKGVSQWAGGYGSHGAKPAVMPAKFFSFAGYTAPDNDTANGDGQVYLGNAIVDSVNITWDWAGGGVLQHQVGFSGDLALTSTPNHAAYLDSTISGPQAVGLCSIQHSIDGSAWVTTANITQAQLNIVAANSAYINSSTASGTGRVPGPIDWTASLAVDGELFGNGVSKNADYWWRFYINATEFYELKWGTVKGFSGLTVDRESQKVVSHSINIEMNATSDIVVPGTPAMGYIKLPDTTTYWPF